MLSPATYRGYNSEGQLVAQGTAESASKYIDTQEISSAAQNLKNVFEQLMQTIATELQTISESSEEAIVIQGTKMSGTIDDTKEIVKQLPHQVLGGIEEINQVAQAAYDNLQTQLNNQMYNQVASYSGVCRIG